MSAPARTSNTCRILEEDRELADGLPAELREQAARECLARTLSIPTGQWRHAYAAEPGAGIGMLVLDGLLIRRVGVDARFGAELLGVGDLLRPWQEEREPPTLPLATGWRVLKPTRVAMLDEVAAQRLARYPPLIGRLVGRALRRSRHLTVNMAIVHQPRVDVRLHMLLWHLAERWGRVRGDGVLVPLALTHSALADLVAARRPSVSSAISQLTKRGALSAVDGGWLLVGEPPGELLMLAPIAPDLTLRSDAQDEAQA